MFTSFTAILLELLYIHGWLGHVRGFIYLTISFVWPQTCCSSVSLQRGLCPISAPQVWKRSSCMENSIFPGDHCDPKKSYSPKRPLFFCFFCILAHDAFRPIKPIIEKIHDCNDKCMNNHDSGKIMCVNMCQPHGIKFFCPGPSAHAGGTTPGFQQASCPLDVFAQAPAKWTCFIAWAFVLYGLPRSWRRGFAIDYCLTCEIESSHNLPKVKTSRQFQRFFWAQVRSLEKRSIFHVLIPNQSGFPMLQHATNVVVLEVANLDPAWGV